MELTSQRITYHLGPDEGRPLSILGALVTRKVSAERTGGVLCFPVHPYLQAERKGRGR